MFAAIISARVILLSLVGSGSTSGSGSGSHSPGSGQGGVRRWGRFEIRGQLGKGGMGTVYRAWDPDLGRELALKVLHGLDVDHKRLARFEREGVIAAQLQHPGIVRIHSTGEANGLLYLTYELVEGGRAHRWARANYENLALLASSDGVLPVFVLQAGLLADGNLDDPGVRRRVYTEYQGLEYAEILRQWKAIGAIQRGAAERHGGLFIDAYAAVPHQSENFHDHVHLTPAGNEAVEAAIFFGLVESSVFNEWLAGSLAHLGSGS